jgi:hypothetical protein
LEDDIPHRTTVWKEILNQAKVVEERVKEELGVRFNNVSQINMCSHNLARIFQDKFHSRFIPGHPKLATHLSLSLVTTLQHHPINLMNGNSKISSLPLRHLRDITWGLNRPC